jgi:hypothetical protein
MQAVIKKAELNATMPVEACKVIMTTFSKNKSVPPLNRMKAMRNIFLKVFCPY